ncbi:MAG: hypothetical protein IJ684_04460, partial [Bacteroidales bacterium]|nr:hypothetical protein [Bacteroidales bacterium]
MYFYELREMIGSLLVPVITLIVMYTILRGIFRGATHRGTVNDSYQGVFYTIQQQHVGVIERLGKFHTIVAPGFHAR